MKKDSIGNRMKNNYELRSQTKLTRRMPIVIRLDGKCFHTFAKNFDRPFSEKLNDLMRKTTIKLCKEISGTKCAYTQSDEISLIVTDYDNIYTEAWFDYEIQKICSISASIATAEFNKWCLINKIKKIECGISDIYDWDELLGKSALFDSRCLNIPKEEVTNYIIWRYQDWVRNSLQMLSQSLYSHKQLHGKNQADMHEMCFQKGCNWNNLHDKWKNGNFCVKIDEKWSFLDKVPDFKKDGRLLIDSLIGYCEIVV